MNKEHPCIQESGRCKHTKMITLTFLPNSNVTFFKSGHKRSINASQPDPVPLQRTRLGRNDRAIQINASTKIHREYPYGYPTKIPNFSSQITNPTKICGYPFRVSSSNPSSLIPRAASETPQEPNSYNIGGGEIAKPKTKTLQLAIIFGLWYFQNVVFNIYNKKALNVFPFPWFLASFQLFVGSVWMIILWSLKLQPCPKISKPFIIALLGPALFHTIGHISACVSFSKVAVSFTHVIKSSEPVFSVIFSSFLGDTYPLTIWLSILPIVFGCSLAAVTEVSFNLQGLWGALISNVGFVLRNIYSKRSLQSFKEVNGLNLYGWISIISLFYLFPVAVLVEGSYWVQGYQKAVATMGTSSTFYIWVMLSGVFYHLYNQSSYQALDDISPLSFSVGNTMKRVVVIISSVVAFRNPVRPLNALGSAIAILGTFLYSQASAAKSAKKIEGEKEDLKNK